MAVEFALILPFLLVLLGGAVSWGHVVAREVTLIQIARDAALAGARTPETDDPEAVARARAEEGLRAAGFDVASSAITIRRVAMACGAGLESRVETRQDALLNVVSLPDHLSAATAARLDDQ